MRITDCLCTGEWGKLPEEKPLMQVPKNRLQNSIGKRIKQYLDHRPMAANRFAIPFLPLSPWFLLFGVCLSRFCSCNVFSHLVHRHLITLIKLLLLGVVLSFNPHFPPVFKTEAPSYFLCSYSLTLSRSSKSR